MYTEEELELLRTEQELIDVHRSIKMERLRAEESELAEMERQAILDDLIEGPLAVKKQKGKLWAEWSVRWWEYNAYDRALQKSIEELAEKLMWVEDEELTERESFEASWLNEWEAIKAGERQRYRIITEWLTVWTEQKDKQWGDERKAHNDAVSDMLWRRTEGKRIDEEEIARWESEIEAILQRSTRLLV